MKNDKYRVMIVDDQNISRQLFESFIREAEDFELAYSPEKETINNQVTQNADSKCCVRLVKNK